MTRSALLILPAILLCLGAAPAPKAPPKATPAKPAPAKPPAAGPFDFQNPQGLMDLLNAAGAKVQTRGRDADAVFVAVSPTTAAPAFSMQFAGCAAQGRACRAVLFDAALDRSAATVAQVNAFNQTSVMCRIYQDKAGLPHVAYSTLLFRSMSRDDGATHLLAWQGCLADARDFLRDPVAYLANAA